MNGLVAIKVGYMSELVYTYGYLILVNLCWLGLLYDQIKF